MKSKKNLPRYVRLATFPTEEVLPYVFTREVRRILREQGYDYESEEWKSRASHRFWYAPGKYVTVPMGSHRYQLFAEKGCSCVRCGVTGTFFALERGRNDHVRRFHFNLYTRLPNGRERMITKDHIIPRSRGGKNKLSNYQPLCVLCNRKKADKL